MTVALKLRKFELTAKKRRNSIYVIYEGYQEGYFLEHLEKHSDVRLNPVHCNGGSANSIVINGIKHSARDVCVYVLFDEDFESKPNHKISNETLEGLANEWRLDKDALTKCPYKQLQILNKNMKNPILIISYPQSFEGFLLRLLNSSKEDSLERKTTKQLKQMIDGIIGNVQLNNEDIVLIQSYDKKIAQYKEEIVNKKKSELNYQEHCRFLESKINDFERRKNKVTFMRFLYEKLPLPVITARRNEILEINILLKAFGL